MAHTVNIRSIEHVTHDVLRIATDKPSGYSYLPGQAADISLPQEGWENELRAFTFTSLPTDDFLEFTIKTYPAHNGVTNQLLAMKKGDSLLVHDAFGDITYKGEGLFIAGGAGITPFMAILKDLEHKKQLGGNTLLFANKTKADIICEDWFKGLLNKNFINVLSDEKVAGYENGYVTQELIAKHIKDSNTYVYLCGPDPMMQALEKHLKELGIAENHIVKEAF